MEKNSKTFSFEFFPPKTASGSQKLIDLAKIFEASKKLLSFRYPSATTPLPSEKRLGINPE